MALGSSTVEETTSPRRMALTAVVLAAVLVAVGVVNVYLAVLGLGLTLVLLLLGLSHGDVVTALTAFLIAVFTVPSSYVVNGVGTLAIPLGLCCFLGWLLTRPAPSPLQGTRLPPVVIATVIMIWVLWLSMAMVYTRVATGLEVGAAHNRFMMFVAAAGVCLLAATRIRDRARLDTLLRRIVLGATFAAVLGFIQYWFGKDYSGLLVPPGLHRYSDQLATGIGVRSDLRRVFGTARHPIEFGVVMAAVLPIALHYAFLARTAGERLRSWAQAVLIAAALPLAISRAATLCFIIAVLAVLPAWNWRRRINFLAVLVLALPVFRAVVPGILGTIVSLFVWAGDDPSVTGRVIDYGLVWDFITERPLLGLGFGSFHPGVYTYLDNQALLSLLETGFIGTAAVVGWLVVGICMGRGVRRHAASQRDRELGQCLVASILTATASVFFFDTFSFVMVTMVLFLVVGCAGALWSMTVAPLGERPAAGRSD